MQHHNHLTYEELFAENPACNAVPGAAPVTSPCILHVQDFKLQPDGHFIDCNVILFLRNEAKEVIEDQNHPIIQAAKETMRNIYPWKVYYIYGEFTPMQMRYTIPIGARKSK